MTEIVEARARTTADQSRVREARGIQNVDGCDTSWVALLDGSVGENNIVVCVTSWEMKVSLRVFHRALSH